MRCGCLQTISTVVLHEFPNLSPSSIAVNALEPFVRKDSDYLGNVEMNGLRCHGDSAEGKPSFGHLPFRLWTVVRNIDQGSDLGTVVRNTDQGNGLGSIVRNIDEGSDLGSNVRNIDEGSDLGSIVKNIDEGTDLGSVVRNIDEGTDLGSRTQERLGSVRYESAVKRVSVTHIGHVCHLSSVLCRIRVKLTTR